MTTTPDFLGLVPRRGYIVLAVPGLSLRSPGVATIRNLSLPQKWDERPGYGYTGATLVFTGAGLASFDVEIRLVEPTDWLAWEAFSALITNPPPPPGTLPTAFGIDHPVLNKKPWLVTKVVVLDVAGFEQDETGSWRTTIKFKQYRKPKPALLPPLEPPPAVDGPAFGPPTAAQKRIQDQIDANDLLKQQLAQ